MVIDMPTEDIESWMVERLHWLQLSSDEELVERLHLLLHRTQQRGLASDEHQLRNLDLASTPLFKTFDHETQSLIRSKLQQLQRREPQQRADVEAEFQQRSPLDQLITKKRNLSKRESKQLEKEKQMVLLRFGQRLTPREVAKRMKCPVAQVYKATERLKVNYKKAIQIDEVMESEQLESRLVAPRYFYSHHVLQREDPHFKQLVHDHIQTEGIYSLKRAKVQEALASNLQSKPPSLKAIAHILKHDFHLRYQRVDGALVHYKDPAFDAKRLWACRLLAQFVTDGALVISIDESHLRSDGAKQFRW